MSPQTPQANSIWLMTGDIPTGPFDPSQVHAKLVAREITWETLACPVGGNTWLPLVQFPGFGPSAAVSPNVPNPSARASAERCLPTELSSPGLSAGRTTPGAVQEPRRSCPWNPTAIAWLGIVFTPMWAGVMAALNGKRLDSLVPARVPLTIGFGYLAVDIVKGIVSENDILEVIFYLGAVWLLWQLALRHQQPLFAARAGAQPGPTARWLWPTVAGSPLALMVFFGFVVTPLSPLEPRQVCERFNAAGSVQEAAKYTMLNLGPALKALYAQKDQGGSVEYELTDEAQAPPEIGGYLVGLRFVSTEAGQTAQIEGAYHLVNFAGEWKIEELYYTTVNHHPLDPRIKLSTDCLGSEFKWNFSIPFCERPPRNA